jgi:hypothetical protein
VSAASDSAGDGEGKRRIEGASFHCEIKQAMLFRKGLYEGGRNWRIGCCNT